MWQRALTGLQKKAYYLRICNFQAKHISFQGAALYHLKQNFEVSNFEWGPGQGKIPLKVQAAAKAILPLKTYFPIGPVGVKVLVANLCVS